LLFKCKNRNGIESATCLVGTTYGISIHFLSFAEIVVLIFFIRHLKKGEKFLTHRVWNEKPTC